MERSINSWFPRSATADGKLLLATRALRGLADGAVSVILPSYLTVIGFSPLRVGAIVFGTLIIVFLALEPEGLNCLWRNVLNYFRIWPFSY